MANLEYLDRRSWTKRLHTVEFCLHGGTDGSNAQ